MSTESTGGFSQVGSASRAELLDVLSDIKARVQDKLGLVDFPLPQFIIIGKQSVGKSRLIETLAGEQFNFVSGTLGSRRPTVLEFRNDSSLENSRWFCREERTSQWTEKPLSEIVRVVGHAHESLGASVSADPCYVRVISPYCVDMQIVDLPGFRDFALDAEKQKLADDIENLVTRFMMDERNVMVCVEECGDAATLGTLSRCKRIDPSFARTILVRNKLDKYYKDLTPNTVNDWMSGYGDLPESLRKFAITCPHWKDGTPPPKPFNKLRDDMSKMDMNELRARGVNDMNARFVGFQSFVTYMEQRIEGMFVGAIGPVLKKLKDLREETTTRQTELNEELENTNPSQITSTIRDVGMSFSHSLNHVMEGFVRSDAGRITLEQELRAFHTYHTSLGSSEEFMLLPSEDFDSLDDYIDYLRHGIKVPAFDVEVNGGAQFRRMMFEVEVFLRFSEIGIETKKKDVIQARGVAMSSLTWRDVVVKLLSNEGHIPMRKRIKYVSERIGWFFKSQKEVIINFMLRIKGSPDEQMYSALYTKHVKLLLDNELVKNFVFKTFDEAVDRQMMQFVELLHNTLASSFANPWVFLKRASRSLIDTNSSDFVFPDKNAKNGPANKAGAATAANSKTSQANQASVTTKSAASAQEPVVNPFLPTFDDTKKRIPVEIASRSGIETLLDKWLGAIPQEPHQIDEAVERVQMLVLRTFAFIRAQIADQIELFAESFFKLPMMRRLEEDMSAIDLTPSDIQSYAIRRDVIVHEATRNKDALQSIEASVTKLQAFAIKAQTRQLTK